MKIAMIIAPVDFRDEEYTVPRKIFEAAGAEVLTFTKGVAQAHGTMGSIVQVDGTIGSAFPSSIIDALVFVGGAGARIFFNDELVLNLVWDVAEQGKVIAAICIAPSILANSGVLRGRKATSFVSEHDNLISKGVLVEHKNVVVDGIFVTADGPAAAAEFAKKVLSVTKKQMSQQ